MRFITFAIFCILPFGEIYCKHPRLKMKTPTSTTLSTTQSTTPPTSKGPCVECSGGLLVDMGGPCYECLYYDTCPVFYQCPQGQYCFLYNASFPLNQYIILGECQENPCLGTPYLGVNGLTTLCNTANDCPNQYYSCVQSVCCDLLLTVPLQTTA